MIKKTFEVWPDCGASASVALFTTKEGIAEAHAILQVEAEDDSFASQSQRLLQGYANLLEVPGIEGLTPVMKRWFLSDAANQMKSFPPDLSDCCVSIIQQPPPNGSRAALWIHFVGSEETEQRDGFTILRRGDVSHLWCATLTSSAPGSYAQAVDLLQKYNAGLAKFGANMADNCLRTWFFVRDVDTQYKGLVDARRDYFNAIGLNRETHYIASTGIGGVSPSLRAIHQLDAYAVKGLKPGQIEYLRAASHMNRTSDYGVTFERATKVRYGDRSHIFISGTASIDNRGAVVHPGDISLQTQRMWSNVEALLKEGGQSWDDVMQIIVYLRDLADASIVRDLFTEKFPDTPFLLTLAPVCRPEWLIEMECIAVKEEENPYPKF